MGDMYYCCIRALGRRVIHILNNGGTGSTWLSAYWEKGESRRDITDKDMRTGIKMAAQVLDYPGQKGISIDRVDTHSLRIGGATVLALAGYTRLNPNSRATILTTIATIATLKTTLKTV